MAVKRSSPVLILAVFAAALVGLSLSSAFVAAPAEQPALRGGANPITFEHEAAQAAALGVAVASIPEAAHAANQGYAVLQLGWAVFIIGLGPAVLFYIYFNKPELL
eukprot:CAMPEP_0170598748 /NCGR_PEP_ID=MMETSP0224-20130122/16415_1 /TAXON_ID=285029 /ORGANISM="Togula jolla, Strain CCCM 725" /LENGTH=105 /DNA_ID=CAMNT_0010923325 /DNA_START=65 /DNA_END=382 /DNA_ORIENTATION=-